MKHDQMKIISGGQTGVDRAALDFAIEHGIDHGGWCPKGRLAEDETIPAKYQLQETPTEYYPERTKRNVRDSDATVIFCRALPLTGGTAHTKTYADKKKKPVEVICEVDGVEKGAQQLATFLERHPIFALNIAGPRESSEPGLANFVR